MIVKIYTGHYDDPKSPHVIFQWIEDIEFYVEDGQPLAKLSRDADRFIRQLDGWAIVLTDCGEVISHYRAVRDTAKIAIAWDRARDEQSTLAQPPRLRHNRGHGEAIQLHRGACSQHL